MLIIKCVYGEYLHSAEVHGLLNDVVVVVETKHWGIDRLVERPGVRCMLLWQQILQDSIAVSQLGIQLAAAHRWWHHGIWQVLLGGLDGSSTHSSPAPGCWFATHHYCSTAHTHIHALVHTEAGVMVYPKWSEGERGVVPTAHPHVDATNTHCAHDGHGYSGWGGCVCFPLHTFFLWGKIRCMGESGKHVLCMVSINNYRLTYYRYLSGWLCWRKTSNGGDALFSCKNRGQTFGHVCLWGGGEDGVRCFRSGRWVCWLGNSRDLMSCSHSSGDCKIEGEDKRTGRCEIAKKIQLKLFIHVFIFFNNWWYGIGVWQTWDAWFYCLLALPLPFRPGFPGLIRPVGEASSSSSWGIWATFWRKAFSRDWAISTMSSVG